VCLLEQSFIMEPDMKVGGVGWAGGHSGIADVQVGVRAWVGGCLGAWDAGWV
jgi:hypothetical protein